MRDGVVQARTHLINQVRGGLRQQVMGVTISKGGSETFPHRVLKEETATPAKGTLLEQQQAFDVFRRVYNEERPQEALKQKTPNQRYTPSLPGPPHLKWLDL